MLIPKGLIHATRNFPGKPALICNDRTYTYAEFFERTAKIKGSLSRLGIKKGDRVACLLLNDFRYMELFYGVTSLGAIIVPINTRYSQEEISFTINDSGAEILYIHEEFLSMLPEIKKNTNTLRHIVLAEDENVYDMNSIHEILSYEVLVKEEFGGDLSTEHLNEDDVAAIYYTGGTTGRSKGVMLTHKNLVFNAYQKQVLYDCDENDIYLHAAPMFHLADGGQVLAFTSFGAVHTFVRSFTPKGVLEMINDKKVTFTLLVPTMINTLVNTPELDQYDVRTLRTIVYGASPISLDVLKKTIEKLPNIEIIQEYGMTETAPILTILPGKDHVISGTEQQMKRLASCGRPVQGVEMKVVDGFGQEVPVGEIGEFIAKGPNVMKGYWNLPEETANAIRDNWYYTGDMGYRDHDNYFYIVDRAKDMIITGGENVYSVEVERILGQLPEILECCVIGVPDEKWGEAVKAVVVLKKGMHISEEEIIAFLRKKLANFKVPKSIDFIEELPKTGPGKILKRKIREQYWLEHDRLVN